MPRTASADTTAIVALLGFTACYLTQWFAGRSARFEAMASRGPWPAPATLVFARKTLGAVVLGLGSVGLVLVALPGDPTRYGWRWIPTSTDLTWIAALGPPILVGVAFSAAVGGEDPVRPEIRLERWPLGLVMANGGFWLLYLAAYEFAIRGVLLMGVGQATGPQLATAVNVALYAAIHLPMGARETAASVPFGILCCAATLHSGSCWPPFVLHAIAAITNDTVRVRKLVS
ncbi:MAG: CPBP family intramembrane metalloprotease [Alphaproteobacteria bacterium]|nr:CPBP family intramembrane metalloprotease [Alphaproteobacteria bacterium]